jgi:hypothetical protein
VKKPIARRNVKSRWWNHGWDIKQWRLSVKGGSPLDSFEEETFLYLDNQSEQNGRVADHPNHENDLPNL